MCGFSGFLTTDVCAPSSLEEIAIRMALAIQHRGLDDAGAWADAQAGIALGHRRLSIVNLSPAGHQPMVSACGRFVIAFNGEIYNHLDLHAELQAAGVAPAWRGHSDTETLLAAFAHWGVVATLQKSVGMFAIALWDVQERTLHLARDRLGEKPLYYGWVNGAFVFGSELQGIARLPWLCQPGEPRGVGPVHAFYLCAGAAQHLSGDLQAGTGVSSQRLRSTPKNGQFSTVASAGDRQGITLRRWWSLAQVVEDGAKNQIVDEQEALTLLEARLDDAVRLQSLADVPVGAFLSGGVDSSAIVALMQAQSSRPVETFTIGFEETGFDESPHARAVAQHLGTNHSAMFVTAAEARDVIPRLPAMYDEPFADSSQIPTHLVCRAARQHVTVALSGDAGDELFGGYNRYFWGPRIWRRLAWLPYPARKALGKAISALPVAGWDALGGPLNALLSGSRGIARVGDKAHKLAARLRGVQDMDDLYLSLVSEWQDPAQVVRGEGAPVIEPPSLLDDPLPAAGVADATLRMMYRDSMTYLPDDILCKATRGNGYQLGNAGAFPGPPRGGACLATAAVAEDSR